MITMVSSQLFIDNITFEWRC